MQIVAEVLLLFFERGWPTVVKAVSHMQSESLRKISVCATADELLQHVNVEFAD
jgi:hypothetical protein